MKYPEPRPVSSYANLRSRIERLLIDDVAGYAADAQLSLDIGTPDSMDERFRLPGKNITEFLDFVTTSVPDGDLYLFGGVLRDIALFGQRGFHSDIDLVVEGSWKACIPFLESLGARRNRFGGYRLFVGGWPVDIWNARETWAITEGHVSYRGIDSLLETTVLNWDAILMNWRTRRFVCHDNYLEMLRHRMMDVVLEYNSNPLGMAVRVFRHLCLKDAKSISIKAARYMTRCTRHYTYGQLVDSELGSYGNRFIEEAIYMMFREFDIESEVHPRQAWDLAGEELQRQGIALSRKQQEFALQFGEQGGRYWQ
ncbi:MAG: hypothetical protein WEB57_09885 [Pseudohongiellaceae bacterium]